MLMQDKQKVINTSKTIYVFSDLHIGFSNEDTNKKIIKYLNKLKDENVIILNGDTLEIWKYDDFTVTPEENIKKIQKIIDFYEGLDELISHDNVLLILGNHDFGLRLIGNNLREVIIENGKAKCFITHGNNCSEETSFETLEKSEGLIYKFFAWLSSKISILLKPFMQVKKSEKMFNTLYDKFSDSEDDIIKEFLKHSENDVVILGHTHKFDYKKFPKSIYINSGNFKMDDNYLKIEKDKIFLGEGNKWIKWS